MSSHFWKLEGEPEIWLNTILAEGDALHIEKAQSALRRKYNNKPTSIQLIRTIFSEVRKIDDDCQLLVQARNFKLYGSSRYGATSVDTKFDCIINLSKKRCEYKQMAEKEILLNVGDTNDFVKGKKVVDRLAVLVDEVLAGGSGEEPYRVLVHCEQGQSRTGAFSLLCIGKLDQYQHSWQDCLQYLRSRRGSISPSPSFLHFCKQIHVSKASGYSNANAIDPTASVSNKTSNSKDSSSKHTNNNIPTVSSTSNNNTNSCTTSSSSSNNTTNHSASNSTNTINSTSSSSYNTSRPTTSTSTATRSLKRGPSSFINDMSKHMSVFEELCVEADEEHGIAQCGLAIMEKCNDSIKKRRKIDMDCDDEW